jgi:hypothetical protein
MSSQTMMATASTNQDSLFLKVMARSKEARSKEKSRMRVESMKKMRLRST